MTQTTIRTAAAMAALAAGAGMLAAPAATAAPGRDLYMVKNLRFNDGVYLGDFAALRKKGAKVVGAVGAFNSEFVCIRGKVRGKKLRAISYDMFNKPDSRFSVKWQGSGAKQRIKGMRSVTRKKMTGYSGTDPKPMIRYCIRNT